MTQPDAAASPSPAAAGAPCAPLAGPRLRVRFAKRGDLRLISHRDLVRAIERLFRRAGIELRQSEGFHPKPRMMFPSALALGIAGHDEVFEADLAHDIEPAELLARLAALAPPGLEFTAVERVPPGARKARARQLCYELALPPERAAEAGLAAARLMAAETCLAERPGRAHSVDLRATLAELAVQGSTLRMTLLAVHEAQARPRDILERLGLADLETQGLLARTRVELDD